MVLQYTSTSQVFRAVSIIIHLRFCPNMFLRSYLPTTPGNVYYIEHETSRITWPPFSLVFHLFVRSSFPRSASLYNGESIFITFYLTRFLKCIVYSRMNNIIESCLYGNSRWEWVNCGEILATLQRQCNLRMLILPLT